MAEETKPAAPSGGKEKNVGMAVLCYLGIFDRCQKRSLREVSHQARSSSVDL